MQNFLPNKTLLFAEGDHTGGTDAAVQSCNSVDLGKYGPHSVVGFLVLGTVAPTGVIDVFFQTSDDNQFAGDDANPVASVKVTTPANSDNKLVGIEVSTDSARLKRYVRMVYQRREADVEILGGFYVLPDARRHGDIVHGDVVAGAVVQEKSAITPSD